MSLLLGNIVFVLLIKCFFLYFLCILSSSYLKGTFSLSSIHFLALCASVCMSVSLFVCFLVSMAVFLCDCMRVNFCLFVFLSLFHEQFVLVLKYIDNNIIS